nr:MAG TPA_asm: hypothetical protein [Caudoviricetes sp.]
MWAEGRISSQGGRQGIRRAALQTWRKRGKTARLYKGVTPICRKGITHG